MDDWESGVEAEAYAGTTSTQERGFVDDDYKLPLDRDFASSLCSEIFGLLLLRDRELFETIPLLWNSICH